MVSGDSHAGRPASGALGLAPLIVDEILERDAAAGKPYDESNSSYPKYEAAGYALGALGLSAIVTGLLLSPGPHARTSTELSFDARLARGSALATLDLRF